ncbi:MAG: DUF2796 domain-containing protein [Nitrosomonas ureae]
MQYKNLILGSLFALTVISEVSSAEMRPSHEAHVHGEAVLNIVLDGNSLLIEFASPAINLLGFEHTPANDAQKSILQNAKQTLMATDRLFYFSTATCRSENIEIEAPHMNQHEDKKHSHHSEHAEHADFHASYAFKCRQEKDLKEIMIKLFTLFPGIHQIKTHWIINGAQGITVLEPNNPILKIN